MVGARAGHAVVRCKNASHFLSALFTNGRRFAFHDIRSWIFRGVADASWNLVPSAFRVILRTPAFGTEPAKASDPSGRKNAIQIGFELEQLRSFIDHADRAGLNLPEDTQLTRELLGKLQHAANWGTLRDEAVVWPPRNLWSLLAKAQHHRVPTRLLDWTWSSRVAAYFAAVEALRRPHIEEMAVWAYRAELHEDVPEAARAVATRVKLVKSPYGANVNLAAQRGVHLLYEPESNAPTATLNVHCIHNALATIHRAYRDEYQIDTLVQFVVPASEAREVINLLRREDVTAASIYPGFDGAAAAVREEFFWLYDYEP